MGRLGDLRHRYHRAICSQLLRSRDGVLNNADRSSKSSRTLAAGIAAAMGCDVSEGSLPAQTLGSMFERLTRDFLRDAFGLLSHLRPGKWKFAVVGLDEGTWTISRFEQYEHLAALAEALRNNRELMVALGQDYLVTPDVIVARYPVSDEEINEMQTVVESDDLLAAGTPFRAANRAPGSLILHASISCKWTIRSDRSQNIRTEALNLIRNRKGHTPRIVAVTAEPMPTRIASLAMGTGDIDCVYHFALPELQRAVSNVGNEEQKEALELLVEGRRLRDVSDLPFDLAI